MFRDFLLKDFKISIISKKTLSWPIEEEEPVVEVRKSASKKGRKSSGKDKGKDKDTGKSKTPVSVEYSQ